MRLTNAGRGRAGIRRGALLCVLLLAGWAGDAPAQDQDAAPPAEAGEEAGAAEETAEAAPLLYIDCGRCDFAHLRRELRFVNHVRDPSLAQIHVLVTDQPTGSSGRRYSLFFQGRDRFAPLRHTLEYTSGPVATSTEQREGLARVLKLGLAPYLALTPLAPRVDLAFDASTPVATAPRSDPWDSWTFQVYGGGNFNLDASQSAWNARYGVYADRVTEEWKLRLRPYFNNNVRVFQTDDGEIRSAQRRHGFESHAIRSIGSNWGAGLFADYITNTFDNLRHRVSLRPAVEYSLFPYEESSRRQVTLSYRVGYQVVDYFQETIYEKTEEALLNQSLDASVHYRQPWGSVWTSLSGSNFLHELEHYRLTFNGSTSFRVAEGISVDLGANFQRIHDQLSLPRGEASLEDILLQQRQLATSYRAWGEIGLSYRFGSIYNNVVNPRL